MSCRQRRRGDQDGTRASRRTRCGSCRTKWCVFPSPRPLQRRSSADCLLGGTTRTVRLLCLGRRAWRRPRVQRMATQLHRVRRRFLALRTCRWRCGRWTAAQMRGGRRPGSVLADDASMTPSALGGLLAAESDSGSVLALVICVIVVPGRTKHVRTSCAGAGSRLFLSTVCP
jgi:hypothetical protein